MVTQTIIDTRIDTKYRSGDTSIQRDTMYRLYHHPSVQYCCSAHTKFKTARMSGSRAAKRRAASEKRSHRRGRCAMASHAQDLSPPTDLTDHTELSAALWTTPQGASLSSGRLAPYPIRHCCDQELCRHWTCRRSKRRGARAQSKLGECPLRSLL